MLRKALAVCQSGAQVFGSALAPWVSFGTAIFIFALFTGCGSSTLKAKQTDGGVGGNGGVYGSGVTSTGGDSVDAAGGAGPNSTGGAGVNATGGAGGTSTGGVGANATGGTGVTSTGGASVNATGGAGVTSTGGASVNATGGAAGSVTGGTGVVAATGGAGGALSCTTVVCPSIPSSCRKIIQDPTACCPTCTDTGCDPCPDLACASGTHPETAVGACCPACVPDPPSACTQGQQGYATMRASMLTKYSSSGCKNSTDCVLVTENNPCAWSCNIPLPSNMSSSFISNLNQAAEGACATCPAPTAPSCEPMIAACANGNCVAANPS